MSTHWMVFVKWPTIVEWKRSLRNASTQGGLYPFQYSSDNVRFLQIKPRDVLWLVTTPRFGAGGKSTFRGRARPPAVMARLRITKMCCNRAIELARANEGKQPVCIGTSLPFCDEPDVLPEGVHPASDAWSIVAIGEKDPEKPEPLQVTYPVLYNFFGVLDQLKFETKRGETDLCDYLKFVKGGQYLNKEQQKARRDGRKVSNPGPYAPFGQIFQTLRKLTPEASGIMDGVHKRAVRGSRVFFSYKWEDVERFANDAGNTRSEWIQKLNLALEEAGYSSWLDGYQVLAEQGIGGLLDEVLADAVQQSVLFVALLSEHYGTGWTLEEWNRAGEQLANERRQDQLLPIVLDCGGDPGRLGLTASDTVSIARSPQPGDVVRAIERGIALHGGCKR